jgi:hypothetical protein
MPTEGICDFVWSAEEHTRYLRKIPRGYGVVGGRTLKLLKRALELPLYLLFLKNKPNSAKVLDKSGRTPAVSGYDLPLEAF